MRHVHHPGERPTDSRRYLDLQFEQIAEQDDSVAVRTTAAQPERTRKKVTVWATALAKKPLTTTAAFVDCVSDQQALVLELRAKNSQIRRGLRPVTQPIGALLAGWLLAVDGPAAPRRVTTHWAGSCDWGGAR